MRLPVNHALSLAALLLVNAAGVQARPAVPAGAPTGPAADYPVTVGEPFTIDGTTWTPSDQLNYDAVGYATSSGSSLAGVSGAHKTLPLPSYVEVTALDTGRTIVVRLVERGPMTNDTLIGLSASAATQLGITPGMRAAVRVRRVNPPEIERASLRNDGVAPQRMATPESLLKVLRRKLGEQSPLAPPPATPPAMPSGAPVDGTSMVSVRKSDNVLKPMTTSKLTPRKGAASGSDAAAATHVADVIEATRGADAVQPPKKAPSEAPTRKTAALKADAAASPSAKTSAAVRPGATVVQVAAFSSRERADAAAKTLGGSVTAVGKLWRVRLGPFKGSGEAAPALEKARRAGYSDARIQRAD